MPADPCVIVCKIIKCQMKNNIILEKERFISKRCTFSMDI